MSYVYVNETLVIRRFLAVLTPLWGGTGLCSLLARSPCFINMATAFMIKLQRWFFFIRLCTRVKTCRSRCEYRLATKKQTSKIFLKPVAIFTVRQYLAPPTSTVLSATYSKYKEIVKTRCQAGIY